MIAATIMPAILLTFLLIFTLGLNTAPTNMINKGKTITIMLRSTKLPTS